MARMYSFGDIKLNISCEMYLKSQGIEVKGGRCVARWRGGTHESVAVDGAKWFDHVDKRGGTVIDLCAIVQFGGDAIRAAQWLGDNFHLTPKAETEARERKTRAQILVESGYVNTATYDYTDEKGDVVYSICRFEKSEDQLKDGESRKTFVHRTPDHECLGDKKEKLLYNLPAVIKATEVYVVEGEKDVETLRGFGITATTNSGGASNWDPNLSHWFAGKDVVVLADNDEPGQKHADLVVACIKPIAKRVRRLTISSLPKGDVTDWVEKEGGTAQKLRELVAAVQESVAADSPQVAAAKAANLHPFRNFVEIMENGKPKEMPITVNELIKECHTRFLDYPRAIGSVMFDWQKDTKRVLYIQTVDDLFAWMERTSKNVIEWKPGLGFVTRGVMFSALAQSCVKYDSISAAPHYPPRTDVFYTYERMPPPDPTHSSFWKLIGFFNPCNSANRTALAAYMVAPMFYDPNADRPLWIIDTTDQQGSGKTALVKMVCHLYNSEYIAVDMRQLDNDIQAVRRRLVSSDARSKRLVLIDNVKHTLRSANLATIITEKYITGLAPYGRTEEVRPNDLTYTVTANNLEAETDIASRAYTVRISKVVDPDPNWQTDVCAYIDQNRMQIFADIIHMMENNGLSHLKRRHGSRFGGFDSRVLTAVCRDESEFAAVDAALSRENDISNVDLDDGQEFREMFLERMKHANIMDVSGSINTDHQTKLDDSKPIFVRASDIDWMLSHSDSRLRTWKARDIYGLVRNGRVPGFDRRVQRINNDATCFDGTDLPHYRGFLWKGSAVGRVTAQVAVHVPDTAWFKVIALCQFDALEDEVPTNVGNVKPAAGVVPFTAPQLDEVFNEEVETLPY